MKIQDYDKALADYSELIKLKPNEIKYINYRAYIYELKNDLQNSLAENEKILKAGPQQSGCEGAQATARTEDCRKDAAYSAAANTHGFASPFTSRQKEALKKRFLRRQTLLRRL